MKTLLFSFLMLTTAIAFSQTILLSDLIAKVKCKEFSCFNDFIVTKGYHYKATIPFDDGSKIYQYFSDIQFTSSLDSEPDKKYYDICAYYIGEGLNKGIIRTGFTAANKSHYVEKIKELQSLLYKSTKTVTNEYGVINTTYTSPKYPGIIITIQIFLSTRRVNDGGVFPNEQFHQEDKTTYEISVEKQKK